MSNYNISWDTYPFQWTETKYIKQTNNPVKKGEYDMKSKCFVLK